MRRFALCITPPLLVALLGSMGCSPSSPASATPPPASVSAEPSPVVPDPVVQPVPAEPAGEVAAAARPEAAAAPVAPAPPIEPVSYKALLDPARVIEGSASIGDGTDGKLRGAVALPKDAAEVAILPICRERDTNFANAALVELLQRTARTLAEAEPGGPRLMVCNMSRERGGNLPWSRSHNSGLDADIAFYVHHNGTPTDAVELMKFNGDLVHPADSTWTFDVARNWRLVKALLMQDQTPVQWIFVGKRLRKAMLEHAVAQGEPAEVLFRAELALWQPSDSTPHTDHFHVRIYCPTRDRAEGCQDTGPTWPWFKPDWSAADARALALSEGLRDPDAAVRTATFDFLKRIAGRRAAPAMAEYAIYEPKFATRAEAIDVLLGWPGGMGDLAWALGAWLAAPGAGFTDEAAALTLPPGGPVLAAPQRLGGRGPRDAVVVRRAYELIERLGPNEAAPFLGVALRSPRLLPNPEGEPTPEARLAADAASGLTTPDIVPHLIEALVHPDDRTRRAVHRALTRVTNHSFGYAWGPGATDAQLRAHAEEWRAWWRANQHRTREELLLLGFKRATPRIDNLKDWDTVERLIRLTDRNDEIGFNADRVLSDLTGSWSPPGLSAEKRRSRWDQWWEQNKGRTETNMTAAQAREKMGECSHQLRGCEYSRLGRPLPEDLIVKPKPKKK